MDSSSCKLIFKGFFPEPTQSHRHPINEFWVKPKFLLDLCHRPPWKRIHCVYISLYNHGAVASSKVLGSSEWLACSPHVHMGPLQVLLSSSIVQCPAFERQVRCEPFFLSVRWQYDEVATRQGCSTPPKWVNGLASVTQTETRGSSCYTLVRLDGSKHHTVIF